MSDADYPDIKFTLGGWLMVLAVVPMFIGLNAPDFVLPGATWIGEAVQIGFLSVAVAMFLAGLVIWFLQRTTTDNTKKSTDGPEAS